MNVATLDEAKGILGTLPLVAEGLMTYEYAGHDPQPAWHVDPRQINLL
jgi:hypothetical protein